MKQKREIPSVSNEARQQEGINLVGAKIFLASRTGIGKNQKVIPLYILKQTSLLGAPLTC